MRIDHLQFVISKDRNWAIVSCLLQRFRKRSKVYSQFDEYVYSLFHFFLFLYFYNCSLIVEYSRTQFVAFKITRFESRTIYFSLLIFGLNNHILNLILNPTIFYDYIAWIIFHIARVFVLCLRRLSSEIFWSHARCVGYFSRETESKDHRVLIRCLFWFLTKYRYLRRMSTYVSLSVLSFTRSLLVSFSLPSR